MTMMESTKKLGQHEDFERRKKFLQIADLLVRNKVSRHFYRKSLKVTL